MGTLWVCRQDSNEGGMWMGKVLDVKPMKQGDPNSCWAACVRMVLFYDKLYLTSDASLAKKLKLPLDKCQDIKSVMEACNIFDSTDDEAKIPTFDEIKGEIEKGRPIIECVSEKKIRKGKDVIGGHYVVIIGHGKSGEGKDQVVIIDPANGSLKQVDYDKERVFLDSYGKHLYWGMPFYTQHGSPF